MQNLRVNGDRLWESLMEMAKIGATEKGGNCRLALTDLDREGRDLFVGWCKDAGCTIKVDQMGNIFARRAGKDDSLPPVMTGSHLDTQPTGGKFDGVYGVLAGLEVIRTLNDLGIETDAPIEASVWTNEEGSRFAPAMVASGVFAGVFDLEYGHSRADLDGKTMGEELDRIGYKGSEPVGGREIRAFFEAHIEQGPILEAEEKTIGVVTGAQGQRWFEVTMTGAESHAGTTPMNRRKDALLGASKVVAAVNDIAMKHAPNAVTTVGLMQVSPNSRNTIPGEVFFAVDLRNPEDEALSAMAAELTEICEKVCSEDGLELDLKEIWYSPPIAFDADCVAAVRNGASSENFAHRDIISGAGHDACYISRVAPTGMIFVPCEDGISHNEVENATPEDLAAGCNVLLQAMVARATV
ncbi:Zn-dependent hydrolase [Pelagibius sp. Alg239-R121]|uniref:Zn-dependent hydrolase n=1 Tax=Pelagibius sp. Alg239-R121 TaxID=2993448 RepID=UPI0024A65A0F|nr:Zn-dependent hydrolase [Pelagibius sp. Alg239-R121]